MMAFLKAKPCGSRTDFFVEAKVRPEKVTLLTRSSAEFPDTLKSTKRFVATN